MRSRVAAGSVILGCVAVAWLAAEALVVARLLQLTIAVSVAYVAVLAWRGGRVMARERRHAASGAGIPTGDARELPFVTVIVPARDEAPVIAALVADLASQRYGVGGSARFDVLIVDDGSSDRTGEVARSAAPAGDLVRVTRREPGIGPATRGAALNHATPYARGEVLAALDADARVGVHFLETAMRLWQREPAAAALQVQKRPTNEASGWLARAQAEELLLDMCSQCGRSAAGGTPELRGNGMFIRRAVLERLGGWAEDALTEDLDMSTRLAAAGERIALAPQAAVGEEAVESLRALWHQRMRWAEGSLRRLIAHGPSLLGGPVALARKLDFIAFLAEFIVPPLFVASLAVNVALAAGGARPDWSVPPSLVLGYGLGTAALTLAGLAADGRSRTGLAAGTLRGTLFLGHWLLVVPAALIRIALGPGRLIYVKTPRNAPRPTSGRAPG